MKRKAKSPLEHYARAQELLAEAEDPQMSEKYLGDGWFQTRVQLAHLHLRAAEVGAALPPELRLVADSISAASLNQPVAGFGPAVGGMTPGQVAGIVDEKLAVEKRRGTIR